MFDWNNATQMLYRISEAQIRAFLSKPDKDDVYGIGFFCDADEGVVYLVANTERYYQSGLLDFEKRFGLTDAELYRWDGGNWEYPGGLFSSSSPDQLDFDRVWKEYQESLSRLAEDDKQVLLEEACLKVLGRLFHEGAFSDAHGLQGMTILGPNDHGGTVLEKKKGLDHFFGGETSM